MAPSRSVRLPGRALALAASLALVLGVASPVAAATTGPLYNWTYAELHYTSETGDAVYEPGLHSRLTIRVSLRDSPDSGATTTVQVISEGWLTNQWGGMEDDWYAAYESIVPADPLLGGIDRNLGTAWVNAGPITLACYSRSCPILPAAISLSGTWTATGPVVATTEKVIDDLGWSSLLMHRQRPADANVVITPGFAFPAILDRSIIATQTQVAKPMP